MFSLRNVIMSLTQYFNNDNIKAGGSGDMDQVEKI